MSIQEMAYARTGLIGNPSDGYFGKTISATIKDFRASVTLTESDELRIEPNHRDELHFASMADLIDDLRVSGYNGGIPLIKATIKKFHDYVTANHIDIGNANFTVKYDSTIPRRVGLAGSSAIVTATMRALQRFYNVEIPKPFLPTLILRVETQELGISAGLQDRVIQVYGGCVHMDFDRDYLEEHEYGRYTEIDPATLPPLFVAYRRTLAEGTEVVHNDLRARWDRGDADVREGMKGFAGLTDRFYEALQKGDVARMGQLMNENFDLRSRLTKISQANWQLVNTARGVGASATFSGSGGAIVGIYTSEEMYRNLQSAMTEIDAQVLQPRIV